MNIKTSIQNINSHSTDLVPNIQIFLTGILIVQETVKYFYLTNDKVHTVFIYSMNIKESIMWFCSETLIWKTGTVYQYVLRNCDLEPTDT